MSKWDATNRQVAKVLGYGFGIVLLLVAARWGDAVFAQPDPSMWQIGAIGGVLLLAGAALLPSTIVPLIYRIIDRIGKDAPDK